MERAKRRGGLRRVMAETLGKKKCRTLLCAVGLAAVSAWAPPALAKDKIKTPDIAREVYCLAVNVYFEAAREPEAGKYGVAHVTMNRRDDPRWPNTVCSVVYEDRAFSWTITHPNKKPADGNAWRQARIVANKVFFGLDRSRELWRGVTFYHADYVREGIKTAWQRRHVEYVQIGRHIFYRPSYSKTTKF